MRGRTDADTRHRRRAVGRGGLLELPGLDEAGRWWFDRVGDEAGRSWKGPDWLDPARGSHGEESHPCRRHGREDLVRILLNGTGAGGMTGAGGESRVVAAHAGHRMRDRVVPFEQTERGTKCRRLGQQEGGQGGKCEPAGAQGLEHQERKVTGRAGMGQRIDPEPGGGEAVPQGEL
jgi:hypothetical protein